MSAVQTFSPPEIVRRFTDDLEPNSDLAIQTKSYQEGLDAEIEIKERLRLSSVIHQPVERYCKRPIASLLEVTDKFCPAHLRESRLPVRLCKPSVTSFSDQSSRRRKPGEKNLASGEFCIAMAPSGDWSRRLAMASR